MPTGQILTNTSTVLYTTYNTEFAKSSRSNAFFINTEPYAGYCVITGNNMSTVNNKL